MNPLFLFYGAGVRTMKSEFTLALNQICSERNLPREIITQVLESALVTSYRKNANIMAAQNVEVKVDIDKGDMKVLVEKEVVDAVIDDRTEVSLEEAKVEKADAAIGDCILVDVTVKDFGRIAAQNVKQMIVQKLREAERDFQYNSFAEREGEIVHGIIQSVTPAGLVLNLGRAEGILPRKEQIPGERLENQQRLRAYVTEVKRTSRGPQIMLSRAHKNMLRRLLEIEIPEIQKSQVEIKSIAREPGSRSKVAVAAIIGGIDPVGACVGQRGTRVQSIVNELNGEKIDVIEWSQDPTVFITKALGPATEDSAHITCLGAGGTITVAFPAFIRNGPGADFAVFENSFLDGYIEHAWVEVSRDGVNFVRFPNHSLTASPVGSFALMDPTDVQGLGCKYRQPYGEPSFLGIGRRLTKEKGEEERRKSNRTP